MANFAQLNESNIVQQVIVINNNECIVNGAEDENVGIQFCKSLFGQETVWKQTSYNASFRKNYAGIGYTYDSVLEAFIPPKPFESWLLNSNTCRWEAPIPYPNDQKLYYWDESQLNWIESVI